MSESCPKCGSAIEYASRPATIRTGHCASCEGDFTFLEGTEAIAIPTGPAPPENGSAEEAEDEEGGEEEEEATLQCATCGSALELSLGAGNTIEAHCPQCNTIQRFVPETAGREERRGRGERSGGWNRGGPSGPGGPGAPAARPCRECGGQLTFTTLPDGKVQGECASCGNKFVLPPRRDDRGGGRGGSRGYRDRSNYRPGGGDRRYNRSQGGGDRYRGKPRSNYRRRSDDE